MNPSRARAPHAAASLPETDYLSSGAAALLGKTLNHVTSHLAALVEQGEMSCLWNIRLETERGDDRSWISQEQHETPSSL